MVVLVIIIIVYKKKQKQKQAGKEDGICYISTLCYGVNEKFPVLFDLVSLFNS